jgi:hypothetical protein
MSLNMRRTWAEAWHDARVARDRCRKTDGKEACRQITCPRCNPALRTCRRAGGAIRGAGRP